MHRSLLLSIVVIQAGISSSASAWHGDGQRPSQQPKTPVDTPRSGKASTSTGDALIRVNYKNKSRETQKCDIVASVKARRPGLAQEMKDFIDGALLHPGRQIDNTFTFEVSQFGRDGAGNLPSLIKSSQKHEMACLTLDNGESPSQVPAPHEYCDPEWDDCDFTCQSSQQQSERCANSNQDWSGDDEFVQEW